MHSRLSLAHAENHVRVTAANKMIKSNNARRGNSDQTHFFVGTHLWFYVCRGKTNPGIKTCCVETHTHSHTQCLGTVRFRDLLLLVAHCCHVFPSELYTNGSDSRAFSAPHNKIYLRFYCLRRQAHEAVRRKTGIMAISLI